MAQYRWVIILTLAVLSVGGLGVWYGQLAVNEGAMRAAMLRDDAAAISSLLDKWPCPVNAYFRGPDVGKMAFGGIRSGPYPRYEHEELTPLLWSILNNNSAVFHKCLDKGASVRFRNGYGGTPLHLAAWKGTGEMVEALIGHGADIRARMAGVYDMLPIHCAGSPETAAALLKHGADPNARDKDGNTPLHWALRGDRPGVVAVLLDGGADVNARGYRGVTPLVKALEDGQQEAAVLLLNRGADVNARDDQGATPIYSVVYRPDRPEAMKLLMSRGADVRVKDKKGYTPLHTAVFGDEAAFDAILAAGADLNARADDGRTPLAYARWLRTAYAHQPDQTAQFDRMVSHLLKLGAKE